MKKTWFLLMIVFVLVLGGCGKSGIKTGEIQETADGDITETPVTDAVIIKLSNQQILVD